MLPAGALERLQDRYDAILTAAETTNPHRPRRPGTRGPVKQSPPTTSSPPCGNTAASLRASFAMGKDGELTHRIHPDPRANFEHTDVSAWDEGGWTLVSIDVDHHNFKNTKSRYVITIVYPQKDISVGQAIATVKKIKLELK